MKRRQDIELLRIISAFAIVWYHSLVAGGEISYAGLIVFLTLSIFLSGKNKQTMTQNVWRRIERLIIPWGVWFLFYALLNVLLKVPMLPQEHGVIAGILMGPSRQLWYMPFIFMCLLVFDLLKGNVSKLLICLGAGLSSLLILAATAWWRPWSLQVGAPIAQWCHAMPAVCLGAFLLFRDEIPDKYSVLILLLIVVVAALMIDFHGVGLPYVLGIYACGLIVFGKLDDYISLELTPISQCMLGVFFIHILILQIMWHLRPVSDALLPTGAFLISFLLVLAMRTGFPKLAKYWS